jgi:hypothetical protein
MVAGAAALGAVAAPAVAGATGPGAAQAALHTADCAQARPEPAPPGQAGALIGIPGHVERALGAAFGGAWFGGDPERFHVAVAPGGDRSAAEAIVAGCGVSAWVVYHEVAYPQSAVRAAHAAITQRLSAAGTWSSSGPEWDGEQFAVVVYLVPETTDEQAAGAAEIVAAVQRETGVRARVAAERQAPPTPSIGPAPGPLPVVTPAPTVPARPRVARAPKLLGRSASRAAALQAGAVVLRVRAGEAGRLSVKIRPRSGRQVVLARGTATATAGRTVRLRAALTQAGRARLATRGPVRVTVTIAGPDRAETRARVVLR